MAKLIQLFFPLSPFCVAILISVSLQIVFGLSRNSIIESQILFQKEPNQPSIFTQDFKLFFIEEERNEIFLKDETPSIEQMDRIGVNMKNSYSQNKLYLGLNNQEIGDNRPKFQPDHDILDFVDLNRKNMITKEENKILRKGPVEPEVFILFDYENTLKFNKNSTAIMDYLKVYFHGVNNRYRTIPEPKIHFKISGVMAALSREAQPYLEMNRIGSKGYDINKVLESLASWIYLQSTKIPRHDVAHLITGEEMLIRDPQSGHYSDSISGLAYLKGSCWISKEWKKSLAVSVVQDTKGIWDGVFTSAHELAHNLGASHDGFGNGISCPWEDGFIMSYSGWGGRNKFYFSQCSIKSMKEFVNSPQGSCLFETSNSPMTLSLYEGTESNGERLSMTMLCKRYTNNPLAYVDPDKSPSDLCKNLICRYPDEMNTGYYVVNLNHPPGDNTSCGKANGVRSNCLNGECQTKSV